MDARVQQPYPARREADGLLLHISLTPPCWPHVPDGALGWHSLRKGVWMAQPPEGRTCFYLRPQAGPGVRAA